MRLGITGSRHGFTNNQSRHFVNFVCENVLTEFHYGDCKGVDEESLWLLVQCGGGGVLHSHPATLSEDWDKRNRAYTSLTVELGIVEHAAKHPLERNKDIVNSSDLLLAYPSAESRGTWHTVRYAESVGVPVIVTD